MTEPGGRRAPPRIFGIERLAALSDGVVAIAITLLVLELKVPQVIEGQTLLAHLFEQRQEFVGWLISFVMIGVVWHDQHFVFSHARGCDTPLILINLAQLCFVSLLPFVSALIGDFPNEAGSIVVFSAVMLANTTVMAANSAYVANRPALHARGEAHLLRYRATFHLVTGPFATLIAVATGYLQHPMVGVSVWLIKPLLVVGYHLLQRAVVEVETLEAEAGRLRHGAE